MKKIIVIFLLIVSTITLVSCDKKEDLTIYEGLVVDKIYDRGYTYTQTIYINKVPMTQIHRIPDRWYVVIYKNEKISKHRISEKYYDTLTVGSYISLEGEIYVEEETK